MPARLPTGFVQLPGSVLRRRTGDVLVHAAHWPANAPDAETGTPVVCVHGLGGSHANWMRVGPRLAGIGPVWAPDLAGFGLTPPPEGRSTSVPDNLDLLAGFIRHMGRGRPVLLIGNSMGGFFALTLAAEHPDLVAGLVLIAPAVPPVLHPPDPRALTLFLAYTIPLLGPWYLDRQARAQPPVETARTMLNLCAADPAAIDDEILAVHAELAARRRGLPHALPSLVRTWRSLLLRLGPGRVCFWRQVERIQAPALVLSGAHDLIVSPESVAALRRRRPDWAGHELAAAGHIPMLERPHQVADLVTRWWTSLGGAATPAGREDTVP